MMGALCDHSLAEFGHFLWVPAIHTSDCELYRECNHVAKEDIQVKIKETKNVNDSQEHSFWRNFMNNSFYAIKEVIEV